MSKYVPSTLYELWKGEKAKRPIRTLGDYEDVYHMFIIYFIHMRIFASRGRSVSS